MYRRFLWEIKTFFTVVHMDTIGPIKKAGLQKKRMSDF